MNVEGVNSKTHCYSISNEPLEFCQRRMNNVQIYILVSCNPLISNSKHGTRDAGINYIHAATCKPVECSRSKGGQDPVWPPHSSVRGNFYCNLSSSTSEPFKGQPMPWMRAYPFPLFSIYFCSPQPLLEKSAEKCKQQLRVSVIFS